MKSNNLLKMPSNFTTTIAQYHKANPAFLFIGIYCSFLFFSPAKAGSPATTLANTIRYASVKSGDSGPDFYSQLNKSFELIFNQSGMNAIPVRVPTGPRTITSLLQGTIDIALVGLNKNVIKEWFPYNSIDIYETSLTELTFYYYSLKNNEADINSLDQQRVGMLRLPEEIIPTLLGRKIGSQFFYRTHLSLAKSLASNHVDSIIASQQAGGRAFRNINIEDDIKNLGEAYKLDLFILVRANLDSEKKLALYELLDKRIPNLISKKAFVTIFTEKIID